MKKQLLNFKKFNLNGIFISLFFCVLSSQLIGQTEGDYRSAKTGGGWASAGTWEAYLATPDIWVTTPTAWAASTIYTVGTQRLSGTNLYIVTTAGTSDATAGPTGTGTGIVDGTVVWDYLAVAPVNSPTATTNVTIMEGVFQTSNGSGYVTNNLTVGQGNAFAGVGVLTSGAVTGVTIKNPGKLMCNPGATFIGPGTTQAAGTLVFKAAGAYAKNKGTGYTNATVVIGTNWAPKTAYTAGQQRISNGNLYTVVTAGTSISSAGPSGTGTNITDSTVVWNYAGVAATAHAVVSGGKITDVIIDTPGSGYLANGASLPPVTISGDGINASYYSQMAVESVTITTAGSYTVPPTVIAGSVMQVGNGTNNRTVTVNGDLTFKAGASLFQGGGASNRVEVLNIGGNLIAETPISCITVVPASTSTTTLNFTKAGTATISGADSCVFFNLNISAATTVQLNSTNNYIGTGTSTGALNITAGGSLILPAGKTLTINGTKFTGPITFNEFTIKANKLFEDPNTLVYASNGKINVVLNDNAAKGRITVYNLVGKQLINKVIEDRTTTIDSKLKTGAYIIKIQRANGTVVSKKLFVK
jgi:hypothetical protein